MKTLSRGWRRHLHRFQRLRRRLAGGQDPKVFCLSCCDSRVSVHEIFDLDEPGTIFEAKNVGGLFSQEAKAALVMALTHLKPDYVVVLHHTACGGYRSTGEDVEPEIRQHMVENSGFHARVRVDGYLAGNNLEIPSELMERLVVEEGCRIQTESMISFLMLHYPRQYKEVKEGRPKIIPLIYETSSGRVYHVPKRLDGSEKMAREEF